MGFSVYGPALVGGLLLGVASSALLLFNGRIAGVSGILGRLLNAEGEVIAWRLWFLGGLLAGGALASRALPSAFATPSPVSTGVLVAAGLLVGFGSRLANGCTSGHGVVGLSRRSWRSLVSVVTFMAVAVVVVFVTQHVLPGA